MTATDEDVPTFGRHTAPTSPGAPASPPPAPSPRMEDPELSAVPRASVLDALRAELASEVDEEGLTLDVPTRADTAVRFSTEVAWEEYTAWRKRSSSKSRATASNPDGVDLMLLASIVVANRAVAIVHRGEDVVASDGELLTFAHHELHEMVNASRATEAVRLFYGRDGHVQIAADLVLQAAGFGDELSEVDETDPTRPGR